MPDGDPNANPHGMAIQFQLSDGAEMDIVANSLAFFPVATGEEFLDLLHGSVRRAARTRPSRPRSSSFVASHPGGAGGGRHVATPSSFARETYNGVNAFVFVDAAGKRQPFRFRIDAGRRCASI